MRKKNKGVLILIIVLVLLLAVYFGLRSWNVSQEEKEEAEQEAATVHVTDTAAEDIVSLKFNVGNGDLEFSKEDDKWYYTPDKDFPLQQSYPEDMAEAVGSITADRELTDGDALDAYGLDDPAYTVEYTDAEGNVTELLFGDMTGDDYYAMISGSDTVYTVGGSVIEALNYSLEDMAQLDDYPSIGSGNLVKEVITQNGETTTYNSEDEDQAEDIAAVAGGLGAVTLSEAADYSVEDEDLDMYGLDEASRITVEGTYTQDDEEQLLTLYIGNEDGNGNRYVMLNDSRIVYLISDEICDNILNN
ncbi:DUF4340 domain-containing protein [Mediterraneibacter glycyrrhizinilyticus]|uniref:DUF4340 domain-containing protein n=1 Tax=Mediterraneibacter glycyrrhizinilyticus TaxID=342942 RepID=UPI0025AA4A27|nr:DUF4340 domain-containing protein [Mediterraneibacter glycyrrhizinilyticus]MDN0061917.1 DUF4340 domain-containing protein [Mediterraneibacter glycyrrhizinilyticus]